MFSSLERHFRGFTYKAEYESREFFNKKMKEGAEGSLDVTWAYLYNEDGQKVAEYRRGDAMGEYLTTSDQEKPLVQIGDVGNGVLYTFGESTIEVDMPEWPDGTAPFDKP